MMRFYRRSEWDDERKQAVARLFAAYNELVRAITQVYLTLMFLIAVVAIAYAFPEAIVRIIGVVR